MFMRFEPRKGDIATVAIHSLEREDALARLAPLGWRIPPPTPETQPEEPDGDLATDVGVVREPEAVPDSPNRTSDA